MATQTKKVCRDCRYAIFQRSESGRIKRQTLGHCTKAGMLLHRVESACEHSPAIDIRIVQVSPTSNARSCVWFMEQVSTP